MTELLKGEQVDPGILVNCEVLLTCYSIPATEENPRCVGIQEHVTGYFRSVNWNWEFADIGQVAQAVIKEDLDLTPIAMVPVTSDRVGLVYKWHSEQFNGEGQSNYQKLCDWFNLVCSHDEQRNMEQDILDFDGGLATPLNKQKMGELQ